jgi:hypothetical protein
MSGGTVGAVIVGGAIAAASAAASVYSSNKQAKAQAAASRKAEEQAKAQAAQQRQQQRRQEGQSADVGAILDQNANAGLSGGSTLLTGAGGVKDNQMSLGGGGNLLG